MHLLKYTDTPEPGVLRWATADELTDWRNKVRLDLGNREHRRIEYQNDFSTDKSIDVVDRDGAGNPIIERPVPSKPREPRELTDLLTHEVLAKHMLFMATHAPDAYMRKIREYRQMAGWGHMTDEQAADQVVELCRKLAQATAQKVVEKGKVGGGYRGVML
jgi:hypothetical protein